MKLFNISKNRFKSYLHPQKIYEITSLLFQSGFIFKPERIIEAGIEAIIDLEGGFDNKKIADHLKIYLYFPIEDGPLPDELLLRWVGHFIFQLQKHSIKTLTHCFMGHNRSSLLNGIALCFSGVRGRDAVKMIQESVPGAFSNKTFKRYVENFK